MAGADSIIVGIDARQGQVAIQGWKEQTETDAIDLAGEMAAFGIDRFIYTDVQRDGEAKGPNIEATVAFAGASQAKVIASGGFSDMSHFQALVATKSSNIEGAIVGTALYEGKLNLREMIQMFE